MSTFLEIEDSRNAAEAGSCSSQCPVFRVHTQQSPTAIHRNHNFGKLTLNPLPCLENKIDCPVKGFPVRDNSLYFLLKKVDY